MEKTSIYIWGLTCDGCAQAVSRAVMALEGVESAEVTSDFDWVNVIFDPKQISPKEMVEAIEAAGYGAEL